jgi:hypothetical protein
MCSVIYPSNVVDAQVGHFLGLNQRRTPVSDYLFGKLRVPLREFLPGDEEYQSAFDRFEYLFGLVHADLNRYILGGGWWGPVGCFSWRGLIYTGERTVIKTIAAELDAKGSDWEPLKAGLFRGSLEEAKLAKEKFDAFISSLPVY